MIVTDKYLSSPSSAGATRKLALVLAVFVLFLTGCGSTSDLNAEASRLFDSGSRIADLTDAGGADNVPRDRLIQAISRADTAGTALRVVIAGPDGEFISASDVVDRYGGTAIAYQEAEVTFEGASRDMSKAQLDRAIDAAKVEPDIGDSAAAFVRIVEDEGIEARGRSKMRTALWLLLIPAAVFMVAGAYSYRRARKSRIKRQRMFAERKAVLADWASQLGPELDALRPSVAASADSAYQRTWHDAHEFVTNVVPSLESATTTEELDAAEMRISRTSIRLRDLRKAVYS